MPTKEKIDSLNLGPFCEKLHKDGIGHLEISRLIKEKFNENIAPTTVYRWLRKNIKDYVAPAYRFNNDIDKEIKNAVTQVIDFSSFDNKSLTPAELATQTESTLLRTFGKITLIIESKIDEYNDTGRIPLNEIKGLKLLTDIMATMTGRSVDKNTLIQIRDSLIND